MYLIDLSLWMCLKWNPDLNEYAVYSDELNAFWIELSWSIFAQDAQMILMYDLPQIILWIYHSNLEKKFN